jgi:hypothetical protein
LSALAVAVAGGSKLSPEAEMRARVLLDFFAAAQDREDIFLVLAQLLKELGRESVRGAEAEAVSGGPQLDVTAPDFGEDPQSLH